MIKRSWCRSGVVLVTVLSQALAVRAESPVETAGEEVRGLVRPVSHALLSSDIRDRVAYIGFRGGETFDVGDRLLEFDCKYYRAELAARTAAHNARKAQHSNNKKLLQLNATSDIEVEISAAEAEQARAEMRKAEAQVDSCVLMAPYAGAVDKLNVNEHEHVAPSDELMTILSHANLEIELLVPSSWINWVRAGVRFELLVDETGSRHLCEISRVGASVDPISQTVTVIGHFVDPQAAAEAPVLAGMSGSARFTTRPN